MPIQEHGRTTRNTGVQPADHGGTMIPDRMTANRSRFAEPQVIPPNNDPASTLALRRAILEASRPRRAHKGRSDTVGIVLLTPALVVIAALILLALLGYFVTWLCFVAVLFASTVINDVVHHWWRRAWPLGTPRALGYPPL
jgi:hypothetical protein